MRKTLGFTLTTDALLCGRRQRHRTPRADPRITTVTRPDCGAWQGFLVCSDSLG